MSRSGRFFIVIITNKTKKLAYRSCNSHLNLAKMKFTGEGRVCLFSSRFIIQKEQKMKKKVDVVFAFCYRREDVRIGNPVNARLSRCHRKRRLTVWDISGTDRSERNAESNRSKTRATKKHGGTCSPERRQWECKLCAARDLSSNPSRLSV